MSKVNVSLDEVFAVPGNVLVTVKAVLIDAQSVVVGTVGILPGAVSKRTDSSGRVAGGFTLKTGRYEVTARSSSVGDLQYRVVMDVPDDALEYEHTQLIVEGAGAFAQPLPVQSNATENTFGIVRLADAPLAVGSGIVYTKTQIDALGQVAILKKDGGRAVYKATADTDLARGVLLHTAQTAAVSGDTIRVEGPGTYQIASPLGKNGVSWHFGNGVLVYSALDTVWSDGGTAMVFKVTGEGEFLNDQSVPHLIDISHASSVVVFYGRSFWCNSNAGAAAAALYVDGGASVKIYASEYIRSDDYDGVWVNEGTVEIYTPLLEGADQGLECSLNADSVIAQVQRIHGDVNPVEYVGGTLRIIGAKLTGANGLICNNDDLTLQNCELAIDGATAITASAARVVKVAGTLGMNKPLHANVSLALSGGRSYSGKRPAVVTADQSVTASTVMTNVTELTLPVQANKTYRFSAELQYDLAAAVSGIKLGMTGPAAATSLVLNARSQLTVNTAPISAQNSAGAFGTLLTLSAAAFNPTTGLKHARVWGVIRNGANAGSLTVQFAQNVSDAGAVTMKAGSILEVEELS